MATELNVIKNTGKHGSDLKIIQFYGGKHKGKMLQLSQGVVKPLENLDGPGFIQLTKENAVALIDEIKNWLEKQ